MDPPSPRSFVSRTCGVSTGALASEAESFAEPFASASNVVSTRRRGRKRLFQQNPELPIHSFPLRVVPYADQIHTPHQFSVSSSLAHSYRQLIKASSIRIIPDRHEVSSTESIESRRRRKLKLQQRSIVRKGIPNIPDASLSCGHFEPLFVAALKASYPGRSYYGPPDFTCAHCHAIFWYAERVKHEVPCHASGVIYNNCCKGGRVVIPPFNIRPEPLASLARFDGDVRSNRFMKNIRQYNCLFAFTSMGAKIDRSMNDGRGPPVFKICGQIHYRIGSLLPSANQPPKFIQLYIYDTSNEVYNRIRALDSSEASGSSLDTSVIEALTCTLDRHNPLVKQFRAARDTLRDYGDEEFVIRIVRAREGDPVQYNLPAVDELAMLVVGDFSIDTFRRDIVIQTRSGSLNQISALHPAFMALQYPLLFPFGERGFQVGVLYHGFQPTNSNARAKVTMQDYFRYMFHYRQNQPNPYLCYGTLSSQIKVDARACIDENRLQYILDHQDDIRVDSIQGITDAVNRGCMEGSEMGKMTVLPASFTGGRRYMIQNYHDAIAICREYGPPDFFVTFTCNPKWPEIAEGVLEAGQRGTDRADVVVRIFNMKLEELLHDIRSGTVFGRCNAGSNFTSRIFSTSWSSYFPSFSIGK
ncbi:uncharacterized protein LOC8068817 isoform X2 [Sorghum bicolor]|uniref:uncharacterized protein LOC8068817 isoform X2 n=1 Tax=Sorghum bicolor TaxID=4558 RepID=UPI000B424106|nr:uncharacterized protein LOC8068817 isoform X2 [Sorghum bicolor]|eukprot:XP_021301588.1 uncharacterized protein LOC8068817 isoform X2 [Sorghum bicolor]